MSDQVWMTLITSFFSMVAAIIAGVFAYLNKQQGNVIHDLVNSNYGISLQVGASALRQIANESRNPKDEESALQAEKLLEEHKKSQANANKQA